MVCSRAVEINKCVQIPGLEINDLAAGIPFTYNISFNLCYIRRFIRFREKSTENLDS